jgi:hypothetical protein
MYWAEGEIGKEYAEALIKTFGIKDNKPTLSVFVYRRLDYLEAYCRGINALRGNK